MRNILYPSGKATYIDKKEPVIDQDLLSAQHEAKDASEKLLVNIIYICMNYS